MESYKVYLTRSAMGELKEPSAAKNLVQKIKTSVMGLAELPFSHALVNDESLTGQGIRQTMVDNYMIFFLASEKDNTVTVIRILYGRGNWINLLKYTPEE